MAAHLEWLDTNVTNWKPQAELQQVSHSSRQVTTSELKSELDTHNLQLLITRNNLDMTLEWVMKSILKY